LSAAEDFIRANTVPGAAPLVPEIRLRLATEITPIWQATEAWLAERNVEPPFWAFAWPGGQAFARHILDHPELVAGKRVLDFAAGGGIAAIACALAGAASVEAAEIDRLALAAMGLNAAANGVGCRLFAGDDATAASKPDVAGEGTPSISQPVMGDEALPSVPQPVMADEVPPSVAQPVMAAERPPSTPFSGSAPQGVDGGPSPAMTMVVSHTSSSQGMDDVSAAMTGRCSHASSSHGMDNASPAMTTVNGRIESPPHTPTAITLSGDVVGAPCRWDLILCGDVCYEAPMTAHIMPWLAAMAAVAEVWIADPGRAYLPKSGLAPFATYAVPTTLELEDRTVRDVVLYRLLGDRRCGGAG
jgi:predicted nicotinamide N-methyase